MKEMVELHNTGNLHAKVWVETPNGDPVLHAIPPHTIIPVEAEIANLFLAEYPGMVLEHRTVTIPDIKDENGQTHPRVWIANATGNPFVPETVFIPPAKDGDKPTEIPNPLFFPQELRWNVKRPEVVIKDASGLPMSHHFPAQPFFLPPYERVSVPAPVAMQLLQRDAFAITHQRGKLVECREPQPFEPNRTWPLNDLIIWAVLADEHFFTPDRLRKGFPSEETYGGDRGKIREARAELWRYIFHMLIDRRRGLPPKAAFEAAKRRVQMEVQQPGSTTPSKRGH